MAPQVIINADDFGYSEGVNEGIRKAYTDGILTSTTILANGPALENTIKNLSSSSLEKPSIGIGVHLTLTYGKPLVPQLWKFAEFSRPNKNNTDLAWKRSAWEKYFSEFSQEQIEKEYSSQIEKILEIFGPIDHLDSHHGSASYTPADKAYIAVATKYHLSLRPLSPLSEKSVYGGDFVIDTDSIEKFRSDGIKTVDSVNMDYWHSQPDPIKAFLTDLEIVPQDSVREYMFHPSIDDSQGPWRIKDLEILTSKEVIAFVKSHGIQLTTYISGAK